MTFFEKYIYKGGPAKLIKRVGLIFIALIIALLVKSWSLAKEPKEPSVTAATENDGNEFDRQVLIITLRETERQISLSLPHRLDDITVLNRVVADQTTLRYFYKVDGVYDSSEWSSLMETELVSFVCGNAVMKDILNQGGSYEFNYVDKNSDPLASIGVPLSKCP